MTQKKNAVFSKVKVTHLKLRINSIQLDIIKQYQLGGTHHRLKTCLYKLIINILTINVNKPVHGKHRTAKKGLFGQQNNEEISIEYSFFFPLLVFWGLWKKGYPKLKGWNYQFLGSHFLRVLKFVSTVCILWGWMLIVLSLWCSETRYMHLLIAWSASLDDGRLLIHFFILFFVWWK